MREEKLSVGRMKGVSQRRSGSLCKQLCINWMEHRRLRRSQHFSLAGRAPDLLTADLGPGTCIILVLCLSSPKVYSLR